MTNEQFIDLVQKAEEEVKKNPEGYKKRLLMFAAFGYLIIGLVLAAALGLTVGVAWLATISTGFAILLFKKKLIIPLLIFAWVLIKSLWVKFEKPEGFELEPQKFPELYNVINQLRVDLDALPIHQLILSAEFNASVVQTPRLGVFGWQRNTLILGLDLLLVLSPDEAKAILAHEFGHLSKNHSRFAGWIYRARATWQKIMDSFDNAEGFGQEMLKKFFDWYVPRFSAYSFVIARENEYEADAVSAQLTSNKVIGKALVKAYVTIPYMEENYWKHFFKKAETTPQPTELPYLGMVRFLSENRQVEEDLKNILSNELKRRTEYGDTHPSLRDRLRALGLKSVPFSEDHVSAAKSWLGKSFVNVLKHFDSEWKENILPSWRERFDYVCQSKKKLEELEEQKNDALSDNDLWEKARLTLEFGSKSEAVLLFQDFKRRHAEDAQANLIIGQLLAGKDDASCLEYFKIAARAFQFRIEALYNGYAYLDKSGKVKEAEAWNKQLQKQIEINQAADEERRTCSPMDDYRSPQLDNENKKRLEKILTLHPKLTQAWLAEKRLRYYQKELPVYIIAFKVKGLFPDWDDLMKEISEMLDFSFDVFVVGAGGDYKKLAKKVMESGEQIV